jgi:hypothetical protein
MTAETMTMTMAASSAPSPSVTQSAPDDANGGKVIGFITGELDGNTATTPTYSVTGQPTNGTVTVDQSGNFTYTPTASSRLLPARLRG